MKRFFLAALVLVVLGVIIVLSKLGIIPFGWQVLTIIGAAIAAPFKLLMNIFGNKEEEIRKRHEEIRLQEAEFQAKLQDKILEHERKVMQLNMEIEKIDSRIEALRKKREMIDEDVEKMDVEKLQSVGRGLFGG